MIIIYVFMLYMSYSNSRYCNEFDYWKQQFWGSIRTQVYEYYHMVCSFNLFLIRLPYKYIAIILSSLLNVIVAIVVDP